ncbi:MAG: CinA family nicotinamide mononucleotide deamidase-related protein [Proteobacteria bacterium]|nr:CinA family nicotinamide mononucleotide deamidase-related protein [Pseudomonadota bacterium]MBU1139874.1 CinA family nicotinamide mononucleotide deamidase-related protein [Pseudomonadota bacterium]MBU1233064.1 CinA family nicotinamide mononucleotide deamidase-related protein [Pseudomonadota bacterium]MBU1418506.1 CinA family nicotinamide mononucleotide deamidase-related protein [Pseudomonadota bacterium]MBU1454877.1 CinA family nicotinamide mononucleotide deamidase-related protein [Pseudomon
MRGEIIAIGNELTSGRIVNTTSGFAAHHLFEAGFDIYAMHTIGDTPTLIGEALKRALGRVDFVLVTGGLGPTDDDLTTEAVSEALNRPTMPNLDLLYQIRSHLQAVSGPVVSPLEKLAWLPQGAETLTPNSKMSGFQLIHDDKPIFFLPGVPYQMQTLLIEQVLPRLADWYKDRLLTVFQRVYKIFGKSEMEINKETKGLKLGEVVEIGYYPVFPDVHLSITVRGSDPVAMQNIFTETCDIVEEKMNQFIYAKDEENMESVVGTLLQQQGQQLTVAESCTGGLISHLLTSVAGSSSYYLGGVVSYANSMKTSLLGVPDSLLQEYGAVSREAAGAMAAGMRKRSAAHIALSVTGIAGPDGGSQEKPVGTVFVGIATGEAVQTHRFLFSGTRYEIQRLTAQTALDLLRRYLLR